MAEVVEFRRDDETPGGWAEGPVKCLACGHEWHGVFRAGERVRLQCPACSLMRGVAAHHYGRKDGVVFTCLSCGSHAFEFYRIDRETHVMCIGCGAWQDIDCIFPPAIGNG